ncbi:MAG: hypothetical protein WCD04_20485 [Terriglobia bacterium]
MDCELLALRHIVTSSVEHSSMLNYCMALSSGEFTSPFPGGEFTSPFPGGEFTSPFPGGEFTSPRGGVKPPLHEPGYRSLLFCSFN